jgi:uncharacterized protein
MESPLGQATTTIRIAAAGDVHCGPERVEAIERALTGVDADLVLLAGDLTNHGEPEEARLLAEACSGADPPVIAVLGNHDWHAGRHREIEEVLGGAGITVLDRGWAVREVSGTEVGVVGTKGFVGGFPGSHLPDFGEPLLRSVYAETTQEVEAIDHGLREVALCPIRIVLLHYSPVAETLEGEVPGIWAFLGSDRMAAPILEHEPSLVLHGHAHNGRLEGTIGTVPVLNVSVPVTGREFWTLELEAGPAPPSPIH